MSIEQALQKKLKNHRSGLIAKLMILLTSDPKKRIELINWVLDNMNNPDIPICNNIESRMNEIILNINQTYLIL